MYIFINQSSKWNYIKIISTKWRGKLNKYLLLSHQNNSDTQYTTKIIIFASYNNTAHLPLLPILKKIENQGTIFFLASCNASCKTIYIKSSVTDKNTHLHQIEKPADKDSKEIFQGLTLMDYSNMITLNSNHTKTMDEQQNWTDTTPSRTENIHLHPSGQTPGRCCEKWHCRPFQRRKRKGNT